MQQLSDSTCIYPNYGCIDSLAYNYDPLSNIDDGSCEYYIYGCTDPTALNYIHMQILMMDHVFI